MEKLNESAAIIPVPEEVNSSIHGRRLSTRKSFGVDYVEKVTDAMLQGRPSSSSGQTDALNDYEAVEGSSHSHGVYIANEVPAICEYFRSRLESFIVECGGSPLHLDGWKVDVMKKTGGLAAFTIDIFYVNTNITVKGSEQRWSACNATFVGRVYRSRVDVAIAVGLMPNFKVLSQLTKVQMHEHSKETRERLLVSQQLQSLNFSCSDVIVLQNGNEITVPSGEASVSGKPENYYFGFGNTTVLSWGDVVCNNLLFHTKSQLYPLGFKCLRQEHDMLSNVVVDCLCEILGSDGKTTYDSITGVNTADENFFPLFRITVAWIVNKTESIVENSVCASVAAVSEPSAGLTAITGSRRVVRVYEGRTPQQAWQGVLLETIGNGEHDIEDFFPSAVATLSSSEQVSAAVSSGEGVYSPTVNASNLTDTDAKEAVTDSSAPAAISSAATTGMESTEPESVIPMSPDTVVVTSSDTAVDTAMTMDEEELALRESVRAARKEYFCTLKQAQSQGKCGSVVPRLMLDYVDSFVDEGLMRLLEGMNDVPSCSNYQFMDTRFKDGGKKHLVKAFSKMFALSKSVDRVEKRRISELVADEREMNKRLKVYVAKQSFIQEGHEMEMEIGPDGAYFDSTMRNGSMMKRKKAGRKNKRDGNDGGEDVNLMVMVRRRRRRGPNGELKPMAFDAEEYSKKTHAKKPTGARQRISLVAQQKARLREIDVAITRLKTVSKREIRKLRDEVKVRVEAAGEVEASGRVKTARSSDALSSGATSAAATVSVASKTREALPLPRQGPIRLSGDSYGQLLEFWSFCNAYNKQLHISSMPHIDYMTAALHMCEPTVRRLSREGCEVSNAASLEHAQFLAMNNPMQNTEQAYHMWYNAMTAEESDAVLNKFAMILCEHLIPEYSRIINYSTGTEEAAAAASRGSGHEAAALAALAACKHKLNLLTWREIARTVLLVTAYKEIGASEEEAVMAVRGSGLVMTPDTADKNLLRLIKARLVSSYNDRAANSEALVGFTSGVCVKIPRPSPCMTSHATLSLCNDTWQQCVDMLFNETSACNWKIYEVIQLMIKVCCQFEDYWYSNSATDAGKTGTKAVAAAANKSSMGKCKLSVFYSSMLKHIQRVRKLLTDSLTTYMIRSPAHTAELKSALEQLCAQFHNAFVVNISVSGPPIAVSDADKLREVKEFEFHKRNVLQLYYTELSELCQEQDSMKATATAVSRGVVEFWKSNQSEIDAILSEYPASDLDDLRTLGLPLLADIDNATVRTAATTSASSDGDAKPDDVNPDAMAVEQEACDDAEAPTVAALTDVPDAVRYSLDLKEEEIRVASLSVAMQRCYAVVRDVMAHEQAAVLNYPVDHEELPGYYDIVKQPLSFYDIRVHLVAGKYVSITDFYTDMNLVLDNALTFNGDGYAVAQSAHKLRVLFERFFYESVLTWNSPLGCHDNCPICRSAEHVNPLPAVKVKPKKAPLPVVTVWTNARKPKAEASQNTFEEPILLAARGRSSNSNLAATKPVVEVPVEVVEDEEEIYEEPESEPELDTPIVDPSGFVNGNVVCSRCEGFYHANCVVAASESAAVTKDVVGQLAWTKVNKSGSFANRPDWFCQSCTDAKSIAHVHPCKLSKVQHPFAKSKEGEGKLGEVVGIEQYKDRLQFIIGFDDVSIRETWTAQQVRKYSVSWQRDDEDNDDESTGMSAPEHVPASVESAVSATGLPALPSGYDWDDYDQVCGLARGYSGWGGTSSSSASFINANYNLAASSRVLEDETFKYYLDAITILSTSHSVSHSTVSTMQSFSAQEWMTLFIALKNKILTTPHLTDALFENENQNDVAAHKVRDVVNRLISGEEESTSANEERSMESIVKEMQSESTGDRDSQQVDMEVGYGVVSTTLTGEFGNGAVASVPVNNDGTSDSATYGGETSTTDADAEWLADDNEDEEPEPEPELDSEGEELVYTPKKTASRRGFNSVTLSHASATVNLTERISSGKRVRKTRQIEDSESEEDEWADEKAEEQAEDVDEAALLQQDFDDAMAESDSEGEDEETRLVQAGSDGAKAMSVDGEGESDKVEEQEPEAETLENWELRRLSRFRARDDVLSTLSILLDVFPLINAQDLDDRIKYKTYRHIVSAFQAERAAAGLDPDVDPAAAMGGNMFDTIPAGIDNTGVATPGLLAAVKAIIPQPPKNPINVQVWEKTYCEKLLRSADLTDVKFIEHAEEAPVAAGVVGEHAVKPAIDSTLEVQVQVDPSASTSVASMLSAQPATVCSYCNCPDTAISSTMVQGCTWEEWYEQIVKVTSQFNFAQGGGGSGSSSYNYCCGRDKLYCANARDNSTDAKKDSKNQATTRCFGRNQFVNAMWVTQSENGNASSSDVSQQQRTVYWIPCDAQDAADELEELSAKHPSALDAASGTVFGSWDTNGSLGGFVLKGSAPMHEFCACALHSKRLDVVMQQIKDENQCLVEVFEGLHRGKIVPLGADDRFNSYFVFSSIPYLFVLHPPVTDKSPSDLGFGLDMTNFKHTSGVPLSLKTIGLSSLAVELSTTADGLLSRYAVHQQHLRRLEAGVGARSVPNLATAVDACIIDRGPVSVHSDGNNRYTKSSTKAASESCRWSVYTDVADVEKLIHSLDCSIKSEQKLSRVLSLLFPSSRSAGAVTHGKTQDDSPLADAQLLASLQEYTAELQRACTASPGLDAAAKSWINNEIDERFQPQLWGRSDSEQEEEEDDEGEQERDKEVSEPVMQLKLRLKANEKDVEHHTNSAPTDTATSSNRTKSQRNDDGDKKSSSSSTVMFKIGDQVLVEAGSFELLWDAVVIDVSTNRTISGKGNGKGKGVTVIEPSVCFYKVRFDYWKCFNVNSKQWYLIDQRGLESNDVLTTHQWQYQYVGWFPASALSMKTSSKVSIQGTLMRKALRDSVDEVPAALKAMKAYMYVNEPDRAHSALHGSSFSAALIGLGGGYFPGYVNAGGAVAPSIGRNKQYSMCTYNDASVFYTLKQALLMLESSLPSGSLDEHSADKWHVSVTNGPAAPLRIQGRQAMSAEAKLCYEVWREGVISSPDAVSLMQCLLFLEFCIKPLWFTQNGLRTILPTLPSRQYALRHASLSMLAVRIFALDQCIRYDKVSVGQGVAAPSRVHAAPSPAPARSKRSHKKKR